MAVSKRKNANKLRANSNLSTVKNQNVPILPQESARSNGGDGGLICFKTRCALALCTILLGCIAIGVFFGNISTEAGAGHVKKSLAQIPAIKMLRARSAGSDLRLQAADSKNIPRPAPIEEGVDSLAKFTSLAGPLANSEIVGLFFGAGWCSMTTPITPLLMALYASVPSGELSIVYVSSDESEKQMREYIEAHGSTDWISSMSFNHGDRNGLKRHFSVCAKKEIQVVLGEHAKRKYEIPTLILLEGGSGRVLSYDGVKDLKTGKVRKASNLFHWKS